MRSLRRNKKKLYLCRSYLDGDLLKFKEPEKIYMNYQPTTSDGDLISLGENYPMYLRLTTEIANKDMFHPKDKLYIYNTPPEKHDVLCKDADYEVSEEPMLFINEIQVVLHRLSDADGY